MSQACAAVAPSLAYEEPNLATILTLSAFLLLLNVLYNVFETLLHAGLIAQLILGAAFGSPLAAILPVSTEMAVQSFGYLGLILLVVDGGMSTRLDILSSPRTLVLALITGSSGIILPIALSMILLPFAYQFTYLESFAVGASLSSTSLGTTFAVINSAANSRQSSTTVKEQQVSTSTSPGGITNTRIGTVLIGAALLDDIVALVLSSVIRTLGETLGRKSTSSTWSIARPIVTSVLLLLGTIVVARFAFRPLAITLAPRLERWNVGDSGSKQRALLNSLYPSLGLTAFVAIVCAFVTIAYVIGSTVLLGAFCAGAFVNYSYSTLQESTRNSMTMAVDPHIAYGAIKTVQERILAPFFFASIGAAIPIRDLFKGETLWKGILFSGLMAVAKVMACLPILGLSLITRSHVRRLRYISNLSSPSEEMQEDHNETNRPKRPWLPALFLGFSLVARGEIGFLIVNVARQVGLLGRESSSDTASLAFNVAIWAITLNTFIGPTVVGIFVKSKGLLDEIESDPSWGLVSR